MRYVVHFGFDDIDYVGTQKFWTYRAAEKRRQLYLAQGYTWAHARRFGRMVMKF